MKLQIIKSEHEEKRENIKAHPLQFMDLKYIADKEADYKAKALKAIQCFRLWRKCYEKKVDILDISYSSIEGIVLRQHAENTILAYRFVRDARKKGFDHYMKSKCLTSYAEQKHAA